MLPKIVNPIAYICTEFGIDNELPTYAGGLGILAGEVISAAADDNFAMVGVGLLHKGRKFDQRITSNGEQTEADSTFDPNTSFLREIETAGKPMIIEMPFAGTTVRIRTYYIRLGDNTILFLMSPNVDHNAEDWRGLLNTLYWGDDDAQIRQNILLGVGSVKLLDALGITPATYHVNEGRAAFTILELIKKLTKDGKHTISDAWDEAREKIVYTNHTLVKAGNISYDKSKMSYFFKLIGFNDTESAFLVEKGIESETDKFDMTRFALNSASRISAVSKAHGKLSAKLWPEYKWNSITNGVHLPRWQTHAYRDPSITDNVLWENHNRKKRDLAQMVLARTGYGYDTNHMVITWARRIATYKQPLVLFSDIERLKNLVKNGDRQIQILYAGKSHPGDAQNKETIKTIIHFMQNELSGNAIFVPDYDISLAKSLVSGSDVWLNTPEVGKEASGTSGMKALSNGVLNLTTKSGWAAEVDWGEFGWEIDATNTAESIYSLLENEIVPLYFDRNDNNLPVTWVAKMRSSIQLSKKYSAERMLSEYKKLLYK